MPYFDFAILGGDRRLSYMIPLLRKRGYRVISYQTREESNEEKLATKKAYPAQSLKEAVESAQALIMGIPICKKGFLNMPKAVPFKDLLMLLKPQQMIFGGSITVPVKEMLNQKTKRVYDFLEEESISIQNAVATAEGVVLEILKHQERILTKEKILMLGFGRCGKNIALRLKGIEARVTVASIDESERAWARALGFEAITLEEAKKRLREYRIAVNTIPAPIFTKKDLEGVIQTTTLYEVASQSCLEDEETWKAAWLQFIYLPGLPGKYKAQSLAEVYTDFVIRKWEEQQKE